MSRHPGPRGPRLRHLLATSILAASSAAILASEPTATWPQWRGPHRDGRVAGTEWPDTLTPDNLKRIYRVELGPSYSGPVVDSRRVYVTETRDRKSEVVRALDRQTGKQVWEREWEGAMTVPFFAMSNGSWIRSTPALDSGRLYVAGMRDVLVCLDVEDGSVEWRFDFPAKLGTPLPSFGFVCSPLVHGDHVYVQAGASLVKLDKKTGAVVWRALEDGGGMYGSAFSSPIVAELGGKEQLVVQTRTLLAGVDPSDGTVRWKVEIPAFRGMNILSPTIHDGGVFTSSYGGGSFFVELPKTKGPGEGESEGDSATIRWKDPAQGYMCTPVLIDGHAYMHMKSQRMTCFDLSTGKRRWTTSERFGKYMSLVTQGRKILALDQRGILLLLRADPESFVSVGKVTVSEDSTWAHLAVCDDEVFVRELGGLSVFRWSGS